MRNKIKTLLAVPTIFAASVFALDPIDPSLYEGFTVEPKVMTSIWAGDCGELREPDPNVPGDQGCHDHGGNPIKNAAVFDGTSLTGIVVKDGFSADVAVINRSFAKDKMATWIMPFEVENWIDGIGLFVFTAVNKDQNTGKWTVFAMNSQPPFLANVPYFVYPTQDVGSVTIDKVVFKPTEETCSEMKNPAYGDKNLNFVFSFCGTYDYIEWNDAKEAGKIYGFAAGDGTGVTVGQFSRGAAGAKIRPMRAYLKYMGRYSLDESPALQKSSAGKVAVLDDSDDVDLPTTIEVRIIEKESSTQGVRIGTMDTRTGEVTLDKWVDLRGRSLNRKPDAQGTYYNNGKKVIIK